MDLFSNCALIAYVEISQETQSFPPDSELVRIRAYRYYEQELANKQDNNSHDTRRTQTSTEKTQAESGENC